jgi:alkylation response protein AidB-like acyl-CoA dehydrogenase
MSALSNIPADALYQVTFDNAVVASDAVVGQVGQGWAPLQRAMIKAAVLQTATIVGAAHSVLDMTKQYAQDREQFGIPIGKNQAVQYMVSDILLDLHRADLLNRQAAFLIDAGKPHVREAAISVAFGKAASAHLHRQAHEVHAGVAFIEEHDLTLFSKHAKHWEMHLGDARHYRELLAESAFVG